MEATEGVYVPVHVVFTVQEEVGQKGVLRIPLYILQSIHASAQYGIMVDRMSSRERGFRHVVTNYCGVPLITPSQQKPFMELFDLALGEPMTQSESEFCSDALEWRGRIDAEIVAVNKLKTLCKQYTDITDLILKKMKKLAPTERVSGYTTHPRSTRYKIMADIFQELYKSPIDPNLEFSVVNLSLNYDEDDHCISLQELEDTSNLLVRFIEQMATKSG
jgi:hypothetical protein